MKLLKLRVLAWQSVGQPSKSIAPNGAIKRSQWAPHGTNRFTVMLEVGDNQQREKEGGQHCPPKSVGQPSKSIASNDAIKTKPTGTDGC